MPRIKLSAPLRRRNSRGKSGSEGGMARRCLARLRPRRSSSSFPVRRSRSSPPPYSGGSRYTSQKPDGTLDAPVKWGWDLKANRTP
jgi:hypothetical protein